MPPTFALPHSPHDLSTQTVSFEEQPVKAEPLGTECSPWVKCNAVVVSSARTCRTKEHLASLRTALEAAQLQPGSEVAAAHYSPLALAGLVFDESERRELNDALVQIVQKVKRASSSLPYPDWQVADNEYILPSATTLSQYVQDYASRMEPFVPILPASYGALPTEILRSNKTAASALLLLLVIAAGAIAGTSPRAEELTSGLLECCKVALEEERGRISHDPLELRMKLMFWNLAAWSGDRRHTDVSDSPRRISPANQRPRTARRFSPLPVPRDGFGRWSTTSTTASSFVLR